MFLIISLFFQLLNISCGSLIGNPDDDDGGEGYGSVDFAITDAPIDSASHVYIRITGLEVSKKGDKWIDIPLSITTEIDLLELQDGTTEAFASLLELEAGDYNQIRLILDEQNSGSIVLDDDSEHPLTVPSGSETGLKIKSKFTITEGEKLKLIIDFDLRKSVKLTGNSSGRKKDGNGKYILKPTLRLLEDKKTGNIKGSTSDEVMVVCTYQSDSSLDTISDCDNAINSAIPKNGNFTLSFLPAGDYKIRLFKTDGQYQDINQIITVTSGETTYVEE